MQTQQAAWRSLQRKSTCIHHQEKTEAVKTCKNRNSSERGNIGVNNIISLSLSLSLSLSWIIAVLSWLHVLLFICTGTETVSLGAKDVFRWGVVLVYIKTEREKHWSYSQPSKKTTHMQLVKNNITKILKVAPSGYLMPDV